MSQSLVGPPGKMYPNSMGYRRLLVETEAVRYE